MMAMWLFMECISKMIDTVKTNNGVEYQLNGSLHRPNGPACVVMGKNDWDWALYGSWHRYYGPADETGTWWIHGEITKDIDD